MSWGILPCGPPQEDGLLESPLVKELMPGHPAKVLLSLLFWRQEEWNIMNPVSDSLLFIVLHIGLLRRVLLVETLVLKEKLQRPLPENPRHPSFCASLGHPHLLIFRQSVDSKGWVSAYLPQEISPGVASTY